MRVLYMLLFFLLTSTSATAFPRKYYSLSEFIAESDCIVIADVVAIEGCLKRSDWGKWHASDGGAKWDDKERQAFDEKVEELLKSSVQPVVKLKPVRYLKGAAEKGLLRVIVEGGCVLPVFSPYEKGKRVLVFLEKEKEGQLYRKIPYSTFLVDSTPREVELYAKRVEQLQKIEALKEGIDKDRQRIAFFISCLRSSGREYESLVPLLAHCRSFAMTFQEEMFTAKDKVYLRKAILKSTRLSKEYATLIDFVKEEEDPEIEQFLLAIIQKKNLVDSESELEAATKLAQILKREDLKAITNKGFKCLWMSTSLYESKHQEIMDEFLKVYSNPKISTGEE